MSGSGSGGDAFLALNAILYCRRFSETVRFYEQTLGLTPGHASDWLVEFEVAPGAFVSVADDRRTPGAIREIDLRTFEPVIGGERRAQVVSAHHLL